MALATGTYEPKREIKVTVWPKPSKDGDGETVYHDVLDSDGSVVGQDITTDQDGNELRHHTPPEGFRRISVPSPGSDGASEVHVRDNGHGGVHRNAAGHAVGIKEGTALVEYPDGTHELLADDYSRRMWEARHNPTGGGS